MSRQTLFLGEMQGSAELPLGEGRKEETHPNQATLCHPSTYPTTGSECICLCTMSVKRKRQQEAGGDTPDIQFSNHFLLEKHSHIQLSLQSTEEQKLMVFFL